MAATFCGILFSLSQNLCIYVAKQPAIQHLKRVFFKSRPSESTWLHMMNVADLSSDRNQRANVGVSLL